MKKRVLICDLDNTLYDWVYYFVSSFYAMIDEVVDVIGIDRDHLLNDFRSVHQSYHDSEHPFSLLETNSVKNRFPQASRFELASKLDFAFRAFNSVRKKTLKLYPDVRETLEILKNKDVTLIAHTESKLFGVVDRLTRLNIQNYFYKIYCRERPLSFRPNDDAWEYLERFPMHRVVELSRHQRKPDVAVLLEICRNENINLKECVYIGDSMARDVLMAKNAGMMAVWAEYGAQHNHFDYQKLVRVSHWSPDDISRERTFSAEAALIQPDYVARQSFAEILELF